jgi:hypothetical protein
MDIAKMSTSHSHYQRAEGGGKLFLDVDSDDPQSIHEAVLSETEARKHSLKDILSRFF